MLHCSLFFFSFFLNSTYIPRKKGYKNMVQTATNCLSMRCYAINIKQIPYWLRIPIPNPPPTNGDICICITTSSPVTSTYPSSHRASAYWPPFIWTPSRGDAGPEKFVFFVRNVNGNGYSSGSSSSLCS